MHNIQGRIQDLSEGGGIGQEFLGTKNFKIRNSLSRAEGENFF